MNINHTGQKFTKKLLIKTFLNFQNGVKNIQTAGYNGACTIDIYRSLKMYIWANHFYIQLFASPFPFPQTLKLRNFLIAPSRSLICTFRNVAKCTIKQNLQRKLLATQFLVIMIKFGISYHDLNAKGPLMQFWLFHLFCSTISIKPWSGVSLRTEVRGDFNIHGSKYF